MTLGPIEDSYPLSPLQQGMLFHHLYAPRTGVDIEQAICVLREDIDAATLQAAWERVARRHAVLRTSFRWEGLSEPLQDVHARVEFSWLCQDWRALPAHEREKRLLAFRREHRMVGFELGHPPLFRLALLDFGPSDYRLVWTFHHAVLDGRSFLIVLREAFDYYEAFRRGEELVLPPPAPYRGYIDFLRRLDATRAAGFWGQMLAGFRAPTPLPIERPTADRRPWSRDSASGDLRLSEAATLALVSLAEQNGWTLNTLCHAGWALLLSRYSGDEDVVFGTTRACRRIPVDGAESMVGMLINTVPVRLRPFSGMPLRRLLDATRAQHIAVREFEHTPLFRIQQWSEVPRGTSLFDSLVVFENYIFDVALRASGSAWMNRELHLFEQTNYPLTLSAYRDRELWLTLDFDPNRFEPVSIERMLLHLRTLLESMPDNLERPVRELPMLTETERRELLGEASLTSASPPGPLVHQAFEAQTERTPAAVAIVSEGEQVTYGELNARAQKIAARLAARGVSRGSVVALCIERSAAMIAALLGVLKAGAAYLPLDPRWPKERLAFLIEDAAPRVLLTQGALLRQFPAGVATLLLDPSPEGPPRHSGISLPAVAREDLAYVIYTSGSTGQPKGVEVSHGALANFTAGAGDGYGISSADTVLQFASLSFDAAAEEIFPTLARGGKLALRAPGMLDSAARFLEKCRQWRVSVLDLPTAYWHELVVALAEEGRELPDDVRLVIIGGERALREKWKAWRRVRNRARLVNSYGPTETTVVATLCDLELSDENGRQELPIGRPIPNVVVRLLDQHLRLVPVGVPGDLFIGGAGLARGYRGRADRTAERFLPDPFSPIPGARLYETGDRARILADGNLEFLGRSDDQVKVRGFRVEPGEIGSVLAGHPGLREAAVVAREDVPGEVSLIAYCVPARDEPLRPADLRRYLAEILPDYMVPRTFVPVASLPLTSAGKLDRRALPAPSAEGSVVPDSSTPPRTSVEAKMAEIWTELLRIPRVGIHENFFELGGHSLSATRLLSRVRDSFGVELSLGTIFESPTIAHLAAAIEHAGVSEPLRSAAAPILSSRRRRVAAAAESAGKGEDG